MILTYLWQWQHPLPTTGYREIIQIVCRLPLMFHNPTGVRTYRWWVSWLMVHPIARWTARDLVAGSCCHVLAGRFSRRVPASICVARLVLGIWAGLFGPARARPKNRSPKHGPARNNLGRASTARRWAWAGPQFPAHRAPGTARIDGPGLGRHGPIKHNLLNFFNLVRYRLYIVVIFRVYVIKWY
jgi:hypothetical protein